MKTPAKPYQCTVYLKGFDGDCSDSRHPNEYCVKWISAADADMVQRWLEVVGLDNVINKWEGGDRDGKFQQYSDNTGSLLNLEDGVDVMLSDKPMNLVEYDYPGLCYGPVEIEVAPGLYQITDGDFDANDWIRESLLVQSLNEQAGTDYVRYVCFVKLFDADIEKWRQYLATDGSDEQRAEDGPFLDFLEAQVQITDGEIIDRIKAMVAEYEGEE